MSITDYHTRHIPEYYDNMYLDGYEPWEIMVANRKRMMRMYDEYLAKKEAHKEEAEVMDYTLHFKSEVKIK